MTLKREPALILSTALAVLQLAVGFGLQLTTDQQGLIMAAIGAVLSLMTGAVVRSKVTPLAAPRSEDGSYLITKADARAEVWAERGMKAPSRSEDLDDPFPPRA